MTPTYSPSRVYQYGTKPRAEALTFALKGGKGVEIAYQDGVVALHDYAHAHGETPEDGHGIGSDGFSDGQLALKLATSAAVPLVAPFLLRMVGILPVREVVSIWIGWYIIVGQKREVHERNFFDA